MDEVISDCPQCDGEGYVPPPEICERCKGEGKVALYPLERLIEGLGIVNRMYPGQNCLVVATHDEIFVGGDSAIDDYSPKDKKRMLELGFSIDEGLGKFSFST